MKILLLMDMFSNGSTGLLAYKALLELGHVVDIWPVAVHDDPPSTGYDVSITWTNHKLDLNKIDAKRKVLIYLDDATLYHPDDYRAFNNRIKNYQFLATFNKMNDVEEFWIPIGSDEEIHKKQNVQEQHKFDVVFIGTLRNKSREKFMIDLSQKCIEQNIRLIVFGNNWQKLIPNQWARFPMYFQNFGFACSQGKVVINQHSGEFSPSNKVHEIAACGGGVHISDKKEGVIECYPEIDTYETVDEAIKLIKYYIANPEARDKQAAYLKELSKQFTYKKQLKELLDRITSEPLTDGQYGISKTLC